MALVNEINLSYAEQTVGFPGQLADLSPSTKESMVQGEASAEIPFGAGITIGTVGDISTVASPTTAVLPSSSESDFEGVVLHSHSYVPAAGYGAELGTTGVKPKAMLSILRKGRVYVQVEDAVTAGAQAYLRYTDNGDLKKGGWRSDDDSSKARLIRGAMFRSSAAAGGIAILEVDVGVFKAAEGLT